MLRLSEATTRSPWALPKIERYDHVVVGVFGDRQRVQDRLAELRRAGFAYEEFGLDRAEVEHGPFDTLLDHGVPAEAARQYQREFDRQHGVVAVRARDRIEEAVNILAA